MSVANKCNLILLTSPTARDPVCLSAFYFMNLSPMTKSQPRQPLNRSLLIFFFSAMTEAAEPDYNASSGSGMTPVPIPISIPLRPENGGPLLGGPKYLYNSELTVLAARLTN